MMKPMSTPPMTDGREKYPAEVRKEVQRLLNNGHRPGVIAEALHLPSGYVYGRIRAMKEQGKQRGVLTMPEVSSEVVALVDVVHSQKGAAR